MGVSDPKTGEVVQGYYIPLRSEIQVDTEHMGRLKMEMNLKIDPEFQSKIPPLTEAEFQQLEKNILEAGEVRNPIAVWNGTIVDGHNRYKIVVAHPEIKWSVREMNFADKWAAFAWMYENQLGQRNLTKAQYTFLVGKLYEARKHTAGGNRGNQYMNLPNPENQDLAKQTRTSDVIAAELGIGHSSVEDAGKYAKGIDAIRDAEPELADAILTAKKKVTKFDIQQVGQASPAERPKMIDSIRKNVSLPRRIRQHEGSSMQNRMDSAEIRGIVETLSNDSCMEYTVENLEEQISANANAFIRLISNLIMEHTDIVNGNRDAVIRAIDESVVTRINQIKERLQNGTQL